jgi:hypothetical protein
MIRLLSLLLIPSILVLGATVAEPTAVSPEKLAKTYCGSCHLYVAPSAFERSHWEQAIFPRMALFMGVYPNDSIRSVFAGTSTTFPVQPLLSKENFEKIRSFYLKKAPITIKLPTLQKVQDSLVGFKVHIPEGRIVPPGISMARFGADKTIYLGDVYAKKLFVLHSDDLSFQKNGSIAEGIVDIEPSGDDVLLTVMGSFSPTEAASGALLRLNMQKGQIEVLQDSLQRPTQTVVGDLDGDGDEDKVVCEFGKYTGQLSWLEQMPDGLHRHTILSRPGAITTQLSDVDADGDLDITTLFGQADEGIWRFINDGHGHFQVKNLLRFGPQYGSSHFQYCDFNKDGWQDIIYTCGDNADFTPVLKPWHGVYIFLNDGKEQFSPYYFYPMYGAYKAEVADFDLDGDLDIAAIAFFPDFSEKRTRSFVLLLNEGKKRMQPYTFPDVGLGRWMVMDSGDPDGDGDIDVLIGAMTFEVPGRPDLVAAWKKAGIPFIFLENTAKK